MQRWLCAALLAVAAPGADADPGAVDFTTLRARLAHAADGDALVRSFLERAGATPIIEAEGATFVVEGDPAAPPRLIGDFNDWGEGEHAGEAAMNRLARTRFFHRSVPLRRDARVEYRFAFGQQERLDPRNPRQAPGFDGPSSELRMPGWAAERGREDRPGRASGRLEGFYFASRALANTRRIQVYLPAGYDTGARRYPSVYFGDGGFYLDTLQAKRILDDLIADGTVEPFVAVFVDPVDRAVEYRRNDDYRRLIVDELLPRVDGAYRTEPSASRRGVYGSSRGALAAVDLAAAHPESFGLCGAVAPAVAPTGIEALLGALPRCAHLVLVETLYDLEWAKDARALAEAVARRGGRATLIQTPEGHNPTTFAHQLDAVLAALLPGAPPPRR